MGDMQERLSRFEEWARKKSELLTSVMEHAGLKRLVEPDFTVRAADTAGAAGALMSTDRDFICDEELWIAHSTSSAGMNTLELSPFVIQSDLDW